ncbi:hypothetical protein [Dictyobacter formicarum]|uniref:Uncharacterized protein n=1 Tax=Dictyobacter formicarum TaxID=2778368 RepID=A0ABQ3VHE3_9CHLR|nr:hypothetical protein [Dictyobacter formicarum]GHO85200.1 hypothetical protein KSZ_32060 [Dictyobacter formicarum]
MTKDELNELKNVLRAETEPIRKQLDQQGSAITRIEKRLDAIEQTQAHMQTALKLVATRGDVEAAVEAGNSQLKADLIKKIQGHERRITNLEDKTDTPNPEKN